MKATTRLMALIMAMMCLPVASKAQNLQFFYDTNRDCITTTFEMFRPDAFGSTFLFVDMDYATNPLVKGRAVGAYTEIAREFCFWQDSKWNWLSVHVEFDGGLAVGDSFDNHWLAGLTYSGHSEDFSKTWSVSAMYNAIPGLRDNAGKCRMHNFQLTGVWGISFLKDWCSFSGFADFWSEGSTLVFLSEPQLWVNLNKIAGWENIPLSVGAELELSSNFAGGKGFYARPAFGAKWTF